MNKAINIAQKRRFATGFTIVEIVIVIAIIGILVTITSVGYNAVVKNAQDASVRGDLQKLDDAFKQFALDSKGSFPDSAIELSSLGLKLTKGSYMTTNKANIYVCTNPTNDEYAVVAMSKSGKRYMVKSEKGISEYTGAVTWNATTVNLAATCAAIDATYAGINGDVTGLVGTGWLAWTGVTDGDQYITNVIANPSLESGTLDSISGYYGPPMTVDATKAAYGTYSAKVVTDTAAVPQGFIWYSNFASGPNLTYTCSVSLAGTAGKSVSVAARLFNPSNFYFSEGQGSKDIVLTSAWQRTSITFTTPAGTGYTGLQVRLAGSSQAAGVTIWADGAMCAQTATNFAYADGGSAGWLWTGTAKTSASSGPGL